MTQQTNQNLTEQALLGFLINNQSSFPAVKPIINSLECFTAEAHRAIWAAMLDLDAEGESWDGITLGNKIKAAGKLKIAGGYTYLAELQENAPASANIAFYAKILRDEYCIRKACAEADGLKKGFDDPETSPGEALSETIRKLQGLQASLGAEQNKIRTVAEIVIDVKKEMEETRKTGIFPALPTGLPGLDRYLGGGLQRGKLNYVAGRPSGGKTSLILNIADHNSPELDLLCFSIETTEKSIVRDRLLPLASGISSMDIKNPMNLADHQYERLWDGLQDVAAYDRFRICDQSTITISSMETLVAAEMGAEGGGFDLILVDYLQLIRPDRREKMREREIADISMRLKALIKEHDLYSLVVCQLNRSNATEKRAPKMSDLRDSGQLEQDADVIILLHRPDEDGDVVEANVVKHKDGPTGKVELIFNKKITRFESAEERY